MVSHTATEFGWELGQLLSCRLLLLHCWESLVAAGQLVGRVLGRFGLSELEMAGNESLLFHRQLFLTFLTNRHIDRHIDRQTDRQADRQAGRQTLTLNLHRP